MAFCTFCGNKLGDADRFCGKCGKPTELYNVATETDNMEWQSHSANKQTNILVSDLENNKFNENVANIKEINNCNNGSEHNYDNDEAINSDNIDTDNEITDNSKNSGTYSPDELLQIEKILSNISSVKKNLPENKRIINNAINKFATNEDINKVMYIIDLTIFGSGKEAILFTEDKLIIKYVGDKFVMKYIDFSHYEAYSNDSKSGIVIYTEAGNKYTLSNNCMCGGEKSAIVVGDFLLMIKEIIKKKDDGKTQVNSFETGIANLLKKYQYKMSNGAIETFGDINNAKFTNAKIKYAKNSIYNQCYLLSDSSIFGSGKNGLMITFWGVFSRVYGDDIAVYFNDIEDISGDKEHLYLTLINGTKITIESTIIYENILCDFIKDLMQFYKVYIDKYDSFDHTNDLYDYKRMINSKGIDYSKQSIDLLIKQKDEGNPYASIELANRYINGINTENDVKMGTKILYELQYSVAYRILGELYFNGEKVDKDTSKAETLFKKANELGDVLANVSLANMYFMGINRSVDYSTAFKMYSKIDKNVPNDKLPDCLKHNIGVCYRFGYGCTADLSKSEEWLLQICNNDEYAKYLLAEMYVDSEDFISKIEQGLNWLNELANEKYMLAVTKLAKLYFYGKVVSQDIELSKKYLKIGITENNPEAYYCYSLICFYEGTNESIEEAYNYMKLAADDGSAEAIRDLAVMYQFGFGVQKNILTANELYTKAAELGDDFSKNWKYHTKRYLNALRIINVSYTKSEEDEENREQDELYISEVKSDTINENELAGMGINSYAFTYPLHIISQKNTNAHIKVKRSFSNIEEQLKRAGLNNLNVHMSNTITSNFTKFFQAQAHGHAMEYAAHVEDMFNFKSASWIGGDNARGGADRVTGLFNKTQIQSKCYADAGQLYNKTFNSDGTPTYTVNGDKNNPMVIEVNSDVYDKYYEQVKQVKGKEYADKYIKDSGFTSEQCKNMAKFGTIDSLRVDMKLGVVQARRAFLLSSVITFSVAKLNGSENDEAIKQAITSGIKSFGVTFTTTLVSSQLMKTNFIKNITIPKKLTGKGTQKVLTKAMGREIGESGASSILKSSTVTAIVTTAVLSSADVARLICGRISKEQLFKNTAVTATNVAAGSVGFYLGASCGSIIPVVGTFIGGVVGATIAGAIASGAVKMTLDAFIENDGDRMLEIFNDNLEQLAVEYMLAEDELEYVIHNIKASSLLTDSGIRDIYVANDRDKFCYDSCKPFVEEVCEIRNYVVIPDEEAVEKIIFEEQKVTV